MGKNKSNRYSDDGFKKTYKKKNKPNRYLIVERNDGKSMSAGISDDKFWELVDAYESGDVSKEDVMRMICNATKSYSVAIADWALLVKRTITKEEKLQIKEILDGKNNRRGN